MNFREMNRAIREPNLCDAFPFTPAPLAIEFSEPGDLTDARPNRKCFNLRDWAEQFEMPGAMVPKLRGIRQWERKE